MRDSLALREARQAWMPSLASLGRKGDRSLGERVDDDSCLEGVLRQLMSGERANGEDQKSD